MGNKITLPPRRIWHFPAIAVFLAVLPLMLTNDYHMGVLVFIGIHTILALGLNLLMGYAGQVSLGHAAFYGIGAYTSAILTTRFGLSPWLGLIAAVCIAGLIAYLIGRPTLRLRGHYLAMATLGFGMIVQIFFLEYYPLTGGTSGLTGIGAFSIAGTELTEDRQYYYLVWTFVVLLMWLSYNIVNSRVGRALRAVHGSEPAAASMGVDTARYKIQIFVLSGMYSGLAGALYAHFVRFVNPGPFDFKMSIELVVMVVIGGMASIWGAILGGASITWLSQSLGSFEDYEILVYGLILMLVMVYMPAGLTKTAVDLAGKWRQSRNKSASGRQDR